MSKKAIIITTINKYENTSIENYLKYNYDIIVVGDKKTPHDTYKNKNIIYLSPESDYFYELSNLLPYNHYCRKNLGYLYVIKNKYDIIFDTDDDNYPMENFDSWNSKNMIFKFIKSPKYPNILSLYTNIHIWPRGYPLELINKKQNIELEDCEEKLKSKIGIYQGLSEGEPDVDAIFRLTNQNYNDDIKFDDNKAFLINKNVYSQGNTQITLWVKPELFHLLYIPCTVSFRFCDILKMYIAQKCMWEYDKLLCYISPIVRQNRNEHDFMKDFHSEYSMYSETLNLIDEIFNNINLNGNKEDILLIYNKLLENKIVLEKEIIILKKWLEFNLYEK